MTGVSVRAQELNMPALRPDPAIIKCSLQILFRPGDIVEVRVPKTLREGTVSGYFDDMGALKRAVLTRTRDAGIYVTLNPVRPELLARCANRLQPFAKELTKDGDILKRRWLLIDIDPNRPSGISASDEEHQAAIEKAMLVSFTLQGEGWPRPVLADSGNGGHLAYHIDLPNDASAEKLVEKVLKGLAQRFDDDRGKIDTTVYNASRIVKLWGTVARKGDSIPARPHRLSAIREDPDGNGLH
jgi:hypothetical protein